MTKKGFIE